MWHYGEPGCLLLILRASIHYTCTTAALLQGASVLATIRHAWPRYLTAKWPSDERKSKFWIHSCSSRPQQVHESWCSEAKKKNHVNELNRVERKLHRWRRNSIAQHWADLSATCIMAQTYSFVYFQWNLDFTVQPLEFQVSWHFCEGEKHHLWCWGFGKTGYTTASQTIFIGLSRLHLQWEPSGNETVN